MKYSANGFNSGQDEQWFNDDLFTKAIFGERAEVYND
jgi:hypothetical protein